MVGQDCVRLYHFILMLYEVHGFPPVRISAVISWVSSTSILEYGLWLVWIYVHSSERRLSATAPWAQLA